jgi:hypothetical protein
VAVLALTNVFTYADGYDFTCDSNEARLVTDVTKLDVTTFCSNGWEESIGGLRTANFTLKGFWQAGSGEMDVEVFPNLGGTKTMTLGPAKTATSVAYLWQGGDFHYEPIAGAHGEAAGFLIESASKDSHGVVRGQLAAVDQAVSGTGVAGSVVNLGDPGAGKYVYASIHVTAAGTSGTVQVQSDTGSAFSSPTTVGSFTLGSSVGGQWLTRVAATSGETHYRFNVSAVSGSYTLSGAIGVQ